MNTEIIDRDSYDRVTDVLYPFTSLSAVPKDILDAAAERGTKVHQIIAAKIIGMGLPDIEDPISKYVDSFDQWSISKRGLYMIKRFYNDSLQITGECDAIYESSDGLVLVDFKTSASIGRTWGLQGSAYSYLAKREGYDIKKIEFVKLDKEGKAPKVFCYLEDMDLFLKCLEIYRRFFKKRQNFSMEDLSI